MLTSLPLLPLASSVEFRCALQPDSCSSCINFGNLDLALVESVLKIFFGRLKETWAHTIVSRGLKKEGGRLSQFATRTMRYHSPSLRRFISIGGLFPTDLGTNSMIAVDFLGIEPSLVGPSGEISGAEALFAAAGETPPASR